MILPDHPDYESIGKELEAFCKQYGIRLEDFFLMLNDQKLIPMLRGKAAEYDAVYVLQQTLSTQEWMVNKLNLNPQPGTKDQDIGVRHRRTGIELIIETKSAVRGSMKSGAHSKNHKVPYYSVKCHRSRTNKDRVYNDQYLADDFDVLVATPANAIIKGKTVSARFELVSSEPRLREILYSHYGVSDDESLITATSKDWRFVLPKAIAVDRGGYKVIPRTPYVLLSDDPNWQPLSQLEPVLDAIVRVKARR